MTEKRNPQDTFLRVLVWILFIFCMLVLTRYILFKGGADHFEMYLAKYDSKKMMKQGIKHANFIPLATLRYFYAIRNHYSYIVAKNILGNIIGFIPLGVLLPILFVRLQQAGKTILAVFLISLGFETTQLIFNLGVFDVDDLLLNTAGGAIGYLFYVISKRLMYMDNIPAALR
ncbi:MAG: VanZ family protein [Bacteroidetes bacterium]|nr:VanZ family protein [Bacteroidota bacterium]MBS1607457.1 VanZ family protein [Bacteroidota bacterium]